MEVFNMIMIKNVNEADKFKYHYGCSELKLTHMCFADDLMVLCNGDTDSLRVVKKSLDEFSRVSSLYPNLNKSIIFFGSIPENDKLEMLQILPFSCGKLLMKYLGVPLLAKRLRIKDCASLIENLIASILSTMHQYWSSVYMLPDAVIKSLDRIFKSFLWNAGSSAKGKVRVAWNLVCRPKEQGGLGLKPLKNGIKYISDSWGWKNMLDIIDKINPYVFYEVGNGQSISTWHDKWCGQGPLDRFISNRDIYDARLANEASLADVICNGNWIWLDEWVSDFPELNQIPVPDLNQRNDVVKWLDNNNNKGTYTTKTAWRSLRDNWPKEGFIGREMSLLAYVIRKYWVGLVTTKNNIILIVESISSLTSGVFFIWKDLKGIKGFFSEKLSGTNEEPSEGDINKNHLEDVNMFEVRLGYWYGFRCKWSGNVASFGITPFLLVNSYSLVFGISMRDEKEQTYQSSGSSENVSECIGSEKIPYFDFIATSGLNVVRIPVGWWMARDLTPPKPYVGGSLHYLDKAFLWEKAQNGYERSSTRVGSLEWGQTEETIQETLGVIEFFTTRARTGNTLLHPNSQFTSSSEFAIIFTVRICRSSSVNELAVIEVSEFAKFLQQTN
ncbi:RNA-directed DNA polymerase, eukaryota, reverse transcriptase zinc-binding domain protein [Tanacetum coccineum]